MRENVSPNHDTDEKESISSQESTTPSRPINVALACPLYDPYPMSTYGRWYSVWYATRSLYYLVWGRTVVELASGAFAFLLSRAMSRRRGRIWLSGL